MSILRLLPIAATAEALRLEVSAAIPATTKIDIGTGVVPMMRIDGESIRAYKEARATYCIDLLERALDTPFIRANVETELTDAEKAKFSAKYLFDTDMAALVTKLTDGNGMPIAVPGGKVCIKDFTDFVVCNGLHNFSALGEGIKALNSPCGREQLLRAWGSIPDTHDYVALLNGCGGAMTKLQHLNYRMSLTLFAQNLFDLDLMVKSGSLPGGVTTNLNSILYRNATSATPPEELRFFAESVMAAGCFKIEFTEKNENAKGAQVVIPQTARAPGAMYGVDDFCYHPEKPHPAQGLVDQNLVDFLKFGKEEVLEIQKFLTLEMGTIEGALTKKDPSEIASYLKENLQETDVKKYLETIYKNTSIKMVVLEWALNGEFRTNGKFLDADFGRTDTTEGIKYCEAINKLVKVMKALGGDRVVRFESQDRSLIVAQQGYNYTEVDKKINIGPCAFSCLGHPNDLTRDLLGCSPKADEALAQE